MGDKPGPEFSVERIDNNKGYCPENCKWATPEEQRKNTRPVIMQKQSRRHLINGEWISLHRASKKYGFKPSTLYKRELLGWTGDDLVS
jgi:hypothetical protein